MGGTASLAWLAAAVGLPFGYYGADGLMRLEPAMQAGLAALALGPALLFWVAASAAGEALKARRIAASLAAKAARAPFEDEGANAQRIASSVRNEIEALNDAVSTAMSRLAELESAAQRNASLMDSAVCASRENTEIMASALRSEHDALLELNGDLKSQTESLAHSVGRQVRLMREASKLVRTEINSAEAALESHMGAFQTSAAALGERTADIQHAADVAAAASASLNGTMTDMLDGLAEATRLTETAKKSTAEAVLTANETASAVRETTRSAVFEAKRAAQLIRAEAAQMQEAANDTLATLKQAAEAARLASEESQAAAERHAATLEKRLTALAATAGAKKAPLAPKREERVVQRAAQPADPVDSFSRLHVAANAAVARTQRPPVRPAPQAEPKRMFKGFGGWANFMPAREDVETLPAAANETVEELFDLVDFGDRPEKSADAMLQADAVELVIESGVDVDEVLAATDLDMIARASRHGPSARRDAVMDAAPVAVNRIARHMRRHAGALAVAQAFRARPELAKSDKKGQASDLVRAYLLIDAALA
ncbi:MAG: hypothetical protein NVV62_05885 [Terricaulis sp.]|nr:hypothetical protein [Terricaulis sp.]